MRDTPGDVPGLAVRFLAARLLREILEGGRQLDEALSSERSIEALEPRDRAFLHVLLLTSLRRKGEIDAVLESFLEKPLPRKSGLAREILCIGAVQLLWLEVPAHAVLDLAVRSAKTDAHAAHFAGLVNAVLRKLAVQGPELLSGLDATRVNAPDWLWQRWAARYGEEDTRRIASAHLSEPALDVSARTAPELWATRLGGTLLPTGTIRLPTEHLPLTALPGFASGDWWVQDAAAAIPVLLFGELGGKRALDLCAAPGGKTMQLCASGAAVTAVDVSKKRLKMLEQNLARTGLGARLVASSVQKLEIQESFDAVLLDAPCTATGTIRRHPELPYLRDEAQINELAGAQQRLLAAAAGYVAPGGRLVYSTCSLEFEEGEEQARRFLADHPDFGLVRPDAAALPAGSVTEEGWIRLLPFMRLGTSEGLDGFFIACFERMA